MKTITTDRLTRIDEPIEGMVYFAHNVTEDTDELTPVIYRGADTWRHKTHDYYEIPQELVGRKTRNLSALELAKYVGQNDKYGRMIQGVFIDKGVACIGGIWLPAGEVELC